MKKTTDFSNRKFTVLVVVSLVAVTLAAYAQIPSLEFVDYDDATYVLENRVVKKGLTVEGLIWSLKTFHGANWHPLTWISHMLDCHLFDLKPAWHHRTSLLLHMANALVLFFFLRQVTGAFWRSAAVAILFVVHPLQVESVAWVAQRKNVLSTFFGFLSLWAYSAYAKEKRMTWYLLTFIFLGLGLMAKPILVTFPFVMLLLDFWPLQRLRPGISRGRHFDGQTLFLRLREKIPLFLPVILSVVLTVAAEGSRGAVQSLGAFSPGVRIANAVVSYCRYIGKIVFPAGLSFFYPHPGSGLPVWQVLAAAFLVAGISVCAVRASKQYPYAAVGWFWYLGTLLPVIGLVQVGHQSMADRYAYIPLVGILIAVVWGASDVASARRSRKVFSGLAAVAAVFAFTIATWVQVGHWQNSTSLFNHALEGTENNSKAHFGLGNVLSREGKLEQAVGHYARALDIEPGYAMTHYNIGNALTRQGNLESAVYHYKRSLEIDPNLSEAHNNLGAVLARRKNVKEAMHHFKEALRTDAENVGARVNLAALFSELNKPEMAELHYREALRLEPTNPDVHLLLGNFFLGRKKIQTAMHHFQKVVELAPDNQTARKILEHYRSELSKDSPAPALR